jgi:thiol-disulfide isomerase/thioredoxin
MRQITIVAIALLAVMACDSAAAHAQSARPAAPAPDTPLSAAAAQLLHLLEQREDDEAVELGSRLIEEHREDAALHALYVISLSQYQGWMEALPLIEEYTARWPDDAWVQVARGKLIREPTRTEEALEAATRARHLAPDDAEIARHVISIYSAHFRHDQAIALADSFIDRGRATAGLRLAKASALRTMATLPGRPDTAAARLAQQEFEAAVAETPPSAAVYLAVAERFLWDRRTADALPLLERAVALSPHSDPVRRAFWRGISARTDLTADEKRAMIDADINAFLDARRHAVGALLAVAQHHRFPRDDERFNLVSDRIQQEHAGTWQAARSAIDRASMTFNAALEQAGTHADSMAAMRQFRDMLWQITALPGANSSVLGGAYSGIYYTLQQDSTSSADELLSVFERLEELSPWPSPNRRHVSLPVALAERGSRLDYAEQLARAGLEPLEEAVEWSRAYGTVEEFAEWLDRAKSDHHATVGWVLFHKGDIAEAKRELEKAHEALNTAPVPPYRLGRIAEAEGDVEAAERWYATGRGRENWDRRSSEALERLYLARNEALDGFDEYLAAIDERDLARRRAKVESERIAEPQALPDFEHDWMDGGRFSSESLKGKVAVINFWGVWCGPCVREAPDIQKFADRFRDHPDVVFITVANDNDLDTTRDFMAEKGYDFQVIFDEGLVRMTNIFAFPTTLFVDRDGTIVFRYVGASLWLVDEYTWRVEALLGEAVSEAAGGESPPADLESAVARVRSLYFGRDFHHGAEEGDAALEQWPESSELAAWTIAHLASSWARWSGRAAESVRAEEAVARAESLLKSRPDDVWGAIALALALTFHGNRRGEALEASLRPLELAPTMPEAVWARGFILHDHRQYQEAAALIEEKWPVMDRQWAELLALKGNALLAMPERWDEGLEIMARAREHDPQNVNAHFLAGFALMGDRQRTDEAVALLERAAALSPGSTNIATFHWRAISNQPDLDAEQKKALIHASSGELLERRGQYPGTLRWVANELVHIGLEEEATELHDRVLTEFAHTVDAEYVLSPRWGVLWLRLLSGRVEDPVPARAELSSMLWSFIDRPYHHRTELLGDAYRILFDQTRRDETVSPVTLLLLARGAVEHARFLVHPELAIGLAERKVRLDVARQIARDGIDAAEEYVSKRLGNFSTPGAAADALDRLLANVYAAIGYVELKAGDLVAAREAIDRGLKLKPENWQVQFRAGALAEAEGDLEAAEIHYAWGEREERLVPYSEQTNRAALERIFAGRHGSLESYEEFVAGIEERDRARRWQRIADSRIAEPRHLPTIDLEWLDGGRMAADELEGRIVVINFWGVWCGPCVAEAPQIQQLHEKYRDDPGVLFLTINVFDPDLARVRSWMAENRYDYPVLVDENYATPYGVRSYPTTWFADTNGRIVFEYSGVSAAVFEEFAWRVEMLQAEVSLSAAAAQAPPARSASGR